MGNLFDRVGPKKRFTREAGSLQQHLLSDDGDVSATITDGHAWRDIFLYEL